MTSMKTTRGTPLWLASVLALTWALVALPAGAQPLAATSFSVTAQITGACTMTATDVNFSNPDLAARALSQTTVDIDCGPGQSFPSITFTSQTSTDTTFQMAGSLGDVLTYEMCVQGGCGLGQIQSGVPLTAQLDGPTTFVTPVEIPAGQTVPPDTYIDVVQVSLDL